MSPSCGECHFWKPRGAGVNGATEGECRVRAPQIITLAGPAGERYPSTCWPVTSRKAWCGEWRAKDDVGG